MKKLTVVLLGPDRTKKSREEAARPLMDYDYYDKLSADEKKWLNDFNRGFYLGQLPRNKKIYKSKRMRLEIYSSDNARKRSVEVGHCVPLRKNFSNPSPEDAIIEAIDLSRGTPKKP